MIFLKNPGENSFLADVQRVKYSLYDHTEQPIIENLLEAITRVANQFNENEHESPRMRLLDYQSFHNHSIAIHRKT